MLMVVVVPVVPVVAFGLDVVAIDVCSEIELVVSRVSCVSRVSWVT